METSSQIHHFSDTSEIRQLVQRFGYEVTYTQVSPGQFSAEAFEVRVGDCLVFRERYDCQILAHGRSTPRGYGVMLPHQGRVRFYGHEVSPKHVVLFSPGCEIDAVGFPGLRLVHFVLPTERIAAAATEWDIDLIQAEHALVVEPGIDRLQHLQSLLDHVSKVLESGNPSAWLAAERELAETFLGLFDVAAIPGGVPVHQNGRAAAHAQQVLRRIFSQPVGNPDLDSVARELGIGRHHLNRCFREHYSVGLREFVHLCRLHQARALLMSQSSEMSITEAAYAGGFNHLGRFSTEYRNLFGETPSQTLRATAPPG